MPNIKSNTKHLRKSKKRQVYNRAIKARLKTVENKILKLISEKKSDEGNLELKNFYKVADKASLKGVFKKNTVARKKSRIAKKIYVILNDDKNQEAKVSGVESKEDS